MMESSGDPGAKSCQDFLPRGRLETLAWLSLGFSFPCLLFSESSKADHCGYSTIPSGQVRAPWRLHCGPRGAGEGAHLEAQAAAIEAALVQSDVLTQEVSSEPLISLEEEPSWLVGGQQVLGIVGQSTELGEGSQVGLEFSQVVAGAEEDAAAVGSHIAGFVQQVCQAAAGCVHQAAVPIGRSLCIQVKEVRHA